MQVTTRSDGREPVPAKGGRFPGLDRQYVRCADDVILEVYSLGYGPAMVLLPSLGRGAVDMIELAEPLAAAGFRVYCPEPRGNVGSKGPLEGKTLHDWAADIAAVIEFFGAQPAVVVGHAHGNWIARTLASDRPELVRALVLLAGSAGKVPPGVDAQPIPAEVRACIERCGDMSLPEAVRLENLCRVFFAPGNDSSVWLDNWNTRLMTMQTLAQKRTPVDDFFAGGVAPILNIQAEHDVIAPQRYARVLSDYLGDRVTDRTIPNAGHALLPEQLEAVVREVLAYVNALPDFVPAVPRLDADKSA